MIMMILFCAAYIVCMAAAAFGYYYLSGAILMAAAAAMAYHYYMISGRRVCPPAVFSLSWIGGTGVSCLKLSRLQTDWEPVTWLCFFLAYAAFTVGYEVVHRRTSGLRQAVNDDSNLSAVSMDSLPDDSAKVYCHDESQLAPESSGSDLSDHESQMNSVGRTLTSSHAPGMNIHSGNILCFMDIIAVVSVISLITEAVILGYVPLFTTDTPHAYSYFHVSGVHYFTISCILLPALGVLYFKNTSAAAGSGISSGMKHRLRNIRNINAVICMSTGIIIPVLLVSRYQLFFGLMLAAFTLLISGGSKIELSFSMKRAVCAAAAAAVLIGLYVFITYERAHSIEYLNGIFEMKEERLPIFISQPYIYIANNFDNFNCLVKELPAFTHGLRMLFPVFALTGLKFVFPELAAFPIYVTKEELTTVTLIYDGYYDFGIAGVVLLTLTIGALSAILEQRAAQNRHKGMYILLYAQLLIYLSLSFFTTWFSNPTTWFLFAVTALGMLIDFKKRREGNDR